MNIIGISAYYHDASCCLLKDGQLVAAASEEAFSRIKHDARMPQQAFRYCLKRGEIGIGDIDLVAYYEDPQRKLSRQLWMGMPDCPPRSPDAFLKLDPQRPVREIREILGYEGPVSCGNHHLSHAASAYYFSGFDRAAILAVDAVGEWATTSYGSANQHEVELFDEVEFPHSLGMLYSSLTSYLGFEVNEGEFKVMGLAPYGAPSYIKQVKQLIEWDGSNDGQFRLDMRYFDFVKGRFMYSDALVSLLGREPREKEAPLDQFYADVARSAQAVLEEVLLDKVRYLHERTGEQRLCMAGGVALNCVANGRIVREGPFSDVFIQPAATDAGSALGAAALAHAQLCGSMPVRKLSHMYWGPSYSRDELDTFFRDTGLAFEDFRGRTGDLLNTVAARLSEGQIIGWFQGGMEFGPRALGARSILADPRRAEMRDRVNATVKKREAFRPFAPAILEEQAEEYFDLAIKSPFMLLTCSVRDQTAFPAITHVDGSARVQTVGPSENPRFYGLLKEFSDITGCPMLLNTSFNLRGEPIVCSPVDALRSFLASDLDCLVLEDLILDKSDIPVEWRDWFPHDTLIKTGIDHTVYTLF